MTDPQATYFEDEHHYRFEAQGVEIVVERFRQNRDGDTIADVQPRNALGPGFLPGEKLNLSSARSIKTYANTLAQRPLQGQIDWFALLGKAAEMAMHRLREGEPAIRLSEVEWKGQPKFIVPPFVDAHGTTILFGDGGTSKSVHALAFALAVATGERTIGDHPVVTGGVLYCDWEADALTHAERLAAICAGLDLNVPDNIEYMERSATLSDSAREIRKAAAAIDAQLLIVDSLGAAAGGDPEKAESVIRAMNAIRSIGIPTLAISHVTKDQRDKTKPFGSVYVHNLARRTVRIDRDQEEEQAEIVVKLSTMKANFGLIPAPRGHRVVFTNDVMHQLEEITFASVGWEDMPTTAASAKYTIALELRAGAMSVAQLSEATGIKHDTIYRTLKRNEDWFVKDGTDWTLRSEQSDTDTNLVRSDVRIGDRTDNTPPLRGVSVPPVRPVGTEEKVSEEERPW